MNRLGFLLLSVLSKNDAVGKVSAMTLKEISGAENFGYKDNTIFKKITEFETAGYIAAGYKEGKAKTFYITEKGKEMLQNAK